MNKRIIILVGICLVLVILLVSKKTEYKETAYTNLDKTIACTEEAKMCPDGSSVSRTGPKCEFAKCPDFVAAKPVVIPEDASNDESDPNPDQIILDPTVPEDGEAVACTMDAMMCPDGSYVGRTAPNCEFSACPASPSDLSQNDAPKDTKIDHVLGETREYNGINITPVSIKEDSRCKDGMQCIWAGRLIIDTKIESSNTTSSNPVAKFFSNTIELEMGKPYIYEGKSVTLLEEQDHKFKFEVK